MPTRTSRGAGKPSPSIRIVNESTKRNLTCGGVVVRVRAKTAADCEGGGPVVSRAKVRRRASVSVSLDLFVPGLDVPSDLDAWLHHYNAERPRPGYRNEGRRSIETLSLLVSQEGE